MKKILLEDKMKERKEVIDIVIEKIKKDYKEDIALLVSNPVDISAKKSSDGFSFYFLPLTERGNRLSTQFLIDGFSYDLYPMQWDRLIATASMDSPEWYLFNETEVVYCGDEKALERFENLKKGLDKVLKGDSHELRINKAYEYFNESYIYLYNMSRYLDDVKSVRLEGAKLLEKIATTLAFINLHYQKVNTGTMIEESMSMSQLPVDYCELVNGIIFASNGEELVSNARKLIDGTRDFLHGIRSNSAQKEPYETIFTGYYEEVKRHIDKCRKAVSERNYYAVYKSSAYLLEEIAQFKTKVNEGIWYDNRNAYSEYCNVVDNNQQTLLNAISSKSDEDILAAINSIETGLIEIIEVNDLEFLNFNSVKEFKEYLAKNR